MKAVKATWMNGRILPGEPVDWPEGSELVVEPIVTEMGKVGLDESEWRDDPAALADWDAWLRSLEPRELSEEEQAAYAAYEEQVRQYTLESVRQKMASGEQA